MSQRVHLVLDDRERAAFQSRATAEGRTLSEWLRLAARERMERDRPTRIASAADLTAVGPGARLGRALGGRGSLAQRVGRTDLTTS
jgi:hypothetical protein